MTTADWALIISIGSLMLALFSLLWNIWSKFIYPKSKMAVSIQTMAVIHKSGNKGQETICINATNLDPTQITLYNAIAKKKRKLFDDKRELGLLNPYNNFPDDMDSSGPFSGGLPKKLDVGEQFSVYFPRKVNWFDMGMYKFGFNDTFGREHWCTKAQANSVKTKLETEGN